jgi:Xaa-Pro dipeptidase
MFDLNAIQSAIRALNLDGWLLYDFRGSNILARRILQFADGAMGSRRCMYFIPATGTPRKLVGSNRVPSITYQVTRQST